MIGFYIETLSDSLLLVWLTERDYGWIMNLISEAALEVRPFVIMKRGEKTTQERTATNPLKGNRAMFWGHVAFGALLRYGPNDPPFHKGNPTLCSAHPDWINVRISRNNIY